MTQPTDHPAPAPSGAPLIFNPFPRISSLAGITIACCVVAAGLVMSRFGARFDGFLDLHTTGHAVALRAALADQVVAVPLAVVIAWVVAMIFRAQAAWLDLLTAIVVARLPVFVSAITFIALLPDPTQLAAASLTPSPATLAVGVVALIAVAWQVTLLVFGMRYAMGMRGGRLAGAVVALLIAAEVGSKLVLARLI